MSRSFKAANNRRIELVRKLYRDGLTPLENGELEQLERFVDAWISQRYPLPTQPLKDLYEELKKAAER